MSPGIGDVVGILRMRVSDQRTSPSGRRRSEKRVLVAPRLASFLFRRRLIALRDLAKSKVVEAPSIKWSAFRAFLSEEDVSIVEFMHASADLVRAFSYPVAAVAASVAAVIAAVHGVNPP